AIGAATGDVSEGISPLPSALKPHIVSGQDHRIDEENLDDDTEEEDIDMLTPKRNILVRDKALVENEIQIIDEVQRARVDKGKGIANLEPGEQVFGQSDKAQFSQQFIPRGRGGRLGPGGRGGRLGETPATPTSASHSDAVPILTDFVATSTSTVTLDHPTSAVVPTQFEIADRMDSKVDIPASGHIDISMEKGVTEVPDPPQTTPVQPKSSPSNKKLGSNKKKKQSFWCCGLLIVVVADALCCSLMEGNGRAVYAGGDVSSVVHDIRKGRCLSSSVLLYSYPQVSILNGIVMGGGVGASPHRPRLQVRLLCCEQGSARFLGLGPDSAILRSISSAKDYDSRINNCEVLPIISIAEESRIGLLNPNDRDAESIGVEMPDLAPECQPNRGKC
ncbi:3-hydroxyisobutyryl-CoA hydrolase, partial [Sarracenia purpurea var. burkii]